MPMAPFYEEFPDLAFAETRSATVRGYKGLPDGSYGFLEYYCNEPNCDCRRVFITVISQDTEDETLATINYGWENAEYYIEWMGSDEDIENLKGPALAPWPAKQTKLAPYLLKLFKEVALEDEAYIKRLRRHYSTFRKAIDAKHSFPARRQPTRSKPERRRPKKSKLRKKSGKR
jgi:hypothetical protein